jgi:hypothetical protein
LERTAGGLEVIAAVRCLSGCAVRQLWRRPRRRWVVLLRVVDRCTGGPWKCCGCSVDCAGELWPAFKAGTSSRASAQNQNENLYQRSARIDDPQPSQPYRA